MAASASVVSAFFFMAYMYMWSEVWNRNHICCYDIQTRFCLPRKGLFTADPQCPCEFSPTFTLFTRTLPTSGMTITKDNIPPEFSNDRRTAYIAHGWTSTFDDTLRNLKDELLIRDDLNVIAVDWRNGAADPTYVPSAANTQSVGALVGAMTNSLRKQPGSNPSFWCIGFSLGAHVCGFTSLTAQPRLERITGLDPAGPSFGTLQNLIGLTKDSAANVDVIHTDAILGSMHARGHVDFYPNGGRDQPGCTPTSSPVYINDPDSVSVEERFITAMTAVDVGCSHSRAVTFMINSVRNTSCYVANQECTDNKDIPNSCAQISSQDQFGVMGYDAINFRYDGYLYLASGNSPPYCVTS